MFSGPPTQRSRTSRRSLRPGLALLVAGAFLLGAPALAGAAEADDGPTSAINITQTDAPDQPACIPGILGLTNTVNSTAKSFTLTVNASAPPCDPIHATAAIYAMPGNGTAWPQNLVETKNFTISAAGTTTIEFVKGCDAQQFDVLVGATPDVIDVTGPFHGPLLFPFDTGTAEQYWGCVEGTTTIPTTVPETTTPPTTAPTGSTVPTQSTVPSEVLGTSTVPQTIAPNNGVPAEVLSSNAKPAELAFTGSSSGTATLVGVLFLVLGCAMIVASRRRNAAA